MAKGPVNIAFVCPGARIERDLAQQFSDFVASICEERATIHFHEQCFLTAGHFAGSDGERSAAFLEVANNPQFDVIWFARGGYGACRLDPSVYEQMNTAAREKTYFGYSDAGVIFARLHAAKIGRPVHGPVAAELPFPGGEKNIARALAYLVDGDEAGVEANAKSGEPVAAFNITVLAHMIGADWFPSLAGHQLMLEDVGEYLYQIDRAMCAITSAPAFAGVAGVRLGRVSKVPENDRPFGADEVEIAQYWCERAGVPYLGRADIGHDCDNKIVPFRRPA